MSLVPLLLVVSWAIITAVVVGLIAYVILYLVALIVPTLDEPVRRRISGIIAGLAGLLYLLTHL